MAGMNRKQVQEKFRNLLEVRHQNLKRAADMHDQASSLMLYGEICGVVAAMKAVGLIDYEQADYIKDRAWALYEGKEPVDEAC